MMNPGSFQRSPPRGGPGRPRALRRPGTGTARGGYVTQTPTWGQPVQSSIGGFMRVPPSDSTGFQPPGNGFFRGQRGRRDHQSQERPREGPPPDDRQLPTPRGGIRAGRPRPRGQRPRSSQDVEMAEFAGGGSMGNEGFRNPIVTQSASNPDAGRTMGFGPKPTEPQVGFQRGGTTGKTWVREKPAPATQKGDGSALRKPARLNRSGEPLIELPNRPMRKPRTQTKPESKQRKKSVSESEEEVQESEEKESEEEEIELAEDEEEKESEESSDHEEEVQEQALIKEERILREKALLQKRRLQEALTKDPPRSPTDSPPSRPKESHKNEVISKPIPHLRRPNPVPNPVHPSSQSLLHRSTLIISDPFEFCSKEEADRRQATRALSIYEMRPHSNPLGSERPDYNPTWVVKEFTRSAAGLDQTANARLGPVLCRTLDYLFNNILDVDKANPGEYTNPPNSTNHRFIDIYRFISNRARAVTKDYKTADQTKSDGYIRDLERIARFHILATVEGLNFTTLEESLRFERDLNFKRLENILISLGEAYADSRDKTYPNEGEFIAYKLLMRIDNQRLVQKWIKDTPQNLRAHPLIQHAVQVVQSYHTHNYARFFRLLTAASFLSAALMTLSFDPIRLQALKSMKKGYQDSEALALPALGKLLGFATDEEAEEYFLFRGLSLEQANEAYAVQFKNVEILEEKFVPSSAPENVMKKMMDMRSKVVSGEGIEPTFPDPPIKIQIPPAPRKEKPLDKELKPIPVPVVQGDSLFIPKPIATLPVSPKPSPISDIKPQIPSVLLNPIPPKKPSISPEINKKTRPEPLPNEFRCPISDADLIDMTESPEEQQKMKTRLQSYRESKRAKTHDSVEKMVLIIKFYRFSHWKSIVESVHLNKDVVQDRKVESEYFKANLQSQVIDDFLETEKNEEKDDFLGPGTAKISYETVVSAMRESGHRKFKVSILSYGQPALDDLLESTLFKDIDVLRESGLCFNNKVDNLYGSDIVFLILTEGELGTVDFSLLPCCYLYILWVYEHREVRQEVLMQELGLTESHFLTVDIVMVAPMYTKSSSCGDTRLYDLILKPISTLIKEAPTRIIQALTLVEMRDFPGFYERGIELLDLPLKRHLLQRNWISGNQWVQVLNEIHIALIGKLDIIYESVSPSPELLSDLQVELEDLEDTRVDYKPIRCILDELQLEYLPSNCDFSYTREEVEAFLMDYASASVSVFEALLPGSTVSLIYELQDVFNESPVSVETGKTVKVVWSDFFLSILTHQMMCLSQFAGEVYMESPMDVRVDDRNIRLESELEVSSLNEVVQEQYHVDYYEPKRRLFPELSVASQIYPKPPSQPQKPTLLRRDIKPAEPTLVKKLKTADLTYYLKGKAPNPESDLLSQLKMSKLQRGEVGNLLIQYSRT